MDLDGAWADAKRLSHLFVRGAANQLSQNLALTRRQQLDASEVEVGISHSPTPNSELLH